MKKILFLILFLPFFAKSQNLDTVSVNLTLKSGDWAFLIGATDTNNDSIHLVQFRRIRDTIRLANPANFNVNIRFNGISGKTVYQMYVMLKSLRTTLYEQIGNNISNQIKAIPNTTLQNFITGYDNQAASLYIGLRNIGKNILIDN